MYFARTPEPEATKDVFEHFFITLCKKFEFLVGKKFDSTTKKLISLPQRFGGLGATNFATINTVSYCVSLFNCAINLNFIENLDENSKNLIFFNIFRKFNCDFTSFINIEFPENLQCWPKNL
ncbi:hypothetical protein RCL1_009020 [Eukaryota sp. TZLM3-RCL]